MSEHTPSFYRDPQLREGIAHKAFEIFGNREIGERQLDDFFLLEGVKLSSEEKAQVGLFVEHVSTRLVNAALRRPGTGSTTKAGAARHLFDPEDQLGFISFHDPAHAIVAYDRSDGKDLVPAFLKVTPTESYTSSKMVEEEFPALVWSKIFGGRPLFVSFLHEDTMRDLFEVMKHDKYEDPVQMQAGLDHIASQVNHRDFESVRRAYEATIVLYLNQTASRRAGAQASAMKEALEIGFRQSQESPEPKYLQLIRNVFENYEKDKKTLFSEFQRICGPLLARLQLKDQKKNTA